MSSFMVTGSRQRNANPPLSLSQASNSLLFTSLATHRRRLAGPGPEPLGKRSSALGPSRQNVKPTSTAGALIARKAKEKAEYEFDFVNYRPTKSRPPSVRSSCRSSLRLGRPTAVQRRRSVDTIRSRISVASSASGSRLSARLAPLIIEQPPSLVNIPLELLLEITSHLFMSDLLNLILVCKSMWTDLTPVLYAKPYFISPYRLAQFVTIVSHNRHLAEMVYELDLSYMSKQSLALAGWREWKYRSEPLYTLPRPQTNYTDNPLCKHPHAHSLLRKYTSGGHDVPLGSLMHIVKACSQLRTINLNDLHIAADYVILPTAPRWRPLIPSLHKPTTYHPTAFTNLLFISDVPKSNTWRGAEFRTLKCGEFVDAMCELKQMTVLSLRRAVWLDRVHAQELVARAGGERGLTKVNFSGCGMNPLQAAWTRKWTARRDKSVRDLIVFE